ncbi:MAG: carbamoyltransferase HypF [Campylobacteraceae bacterium]|jgi:hydrogenase maturation protein HypF|nr:carbamoyltransferase HypF [Campylobacteraceae bacterium]
MKICKAYEIEGRVQGVGFRPFVFALAQKYNLKGFVYNRSNGVYAEIEGNENAVKEFEFELENHTPPLALIDKIVANSISLKNFTDFKILKSEISYSKNTLVSPDMSLCPECLKEMSDTNNRRFGYPLINCTNCGPRYSIIHTVPYDRVNTSMNKFKMCPQCEAEYNDPSNRRYHAQPISCKNCGPAIKFYDLNGFNTTNDPLQQLALAINEGKIVALKGMGGFHIICDAMNEQTILKLRDKKRRKTKPFAVLFDSLEMIKKYCDTTKYEEEALLSQVRPIVLVKKKKQCALPYSIAPNTNRLGVFLPYTPLHVLLLDILKKPIIATSANMSGEPIITSRHEIEQKLGRIIEAYVDFDREIVNFSDDSVLQLVGKDTIFLRVSRGIAPKSFKTSYMHKEKILALGGHQKSAIAIFNDSNITISSHIGDLENMESIEAFERSIDTFKRFYDFTPSLLVCDKHPNYASTLWAKKQGIHIIFVQHHYAHILAVMFEHTINEEVLGVAWDGTGFGDDKNIWGGEFFLCDLKTYKRVYSFKPFKLLGGESSIKNIDRIAFSILYSLKDNAFAASFLDSFPKKERYLLEQAYKKDINAPLCCSVGRLFDAAAAIILKQKTATYDGESGLSLESLYDEDVQDRYDIIINENNEIEYAHWFLEMLQEKPVLAASKFINTLSASITHIAKKYKKKVVLSGGVFQNRTLVKKTMELLGKEQLFLPKTISPNDSSIALGQITYALNNPQTFEQ